MLRRTPNTTPSQPTIIDVAELTVKNSPSRILLPITAIIDSLGNNYIARLIGLALDDNYTATAEDLKQIETLLNAWGALDATSGTEAYKEQHKNLKEFLKDRTKNIWEDQSTVDKICKSINDGYTTAWGDLPDLNGIKIEISDVLRKEIDECTDILNPARANPPSTDTANADNAANPGDAASANPSSADAASTNTADNRDAADKKLSAIIELAFRIKKLSQLIGLKKYQQIQAEIKRKEISKGEDPAKIFSDIYQYYRHVLLVDENGKIEASEGSKREEYFKELNEELFWHFRSASITEFSAMRGEFSKRLKHLLNESQYNATNDAMNVLIQNLSNAISIQKYIQLLSDALTNANTPNSTLSPAKPIIRDHLVAIEQTISFRATDAKRAPHPEDTVDIACRMNTQRMAWTIKTSCAISEEDVIKFRIISKLRELAKDHIEIANDINNQINIFYSPSANDSVQENPPTPQGQTLQKYNSLLSAMNTWSKSSKLSDKIEEIQKEICSEVETYYSTAYPDTKGQIEKLKLLATYRYHEKLKLSTQQNELTGWKAFFLRRWYSLVFDDTFKQIDTAFQGIQTQIDLVEAPLSDQVASQSASNNDPARTPAGTICSLISTLNSIYSQPYCQGNSWPARKIKDYIRIQLVNYIYKIVIPNANQLQEKMDDIIKLIDASKAFKEAGLDTQTGFGKQLADYLQAVKKTNTATTAPTSKQNEHEDKLTVTCETEQIKASSHLRGFYTDLKDTLIATIKSAKLTKSGIFSLSESRKATEAKSVTSLFKSAAGALTSSIQVPVTPVITFAETQVVNHFEAENKHNINNLADAEINSTICEYLARKFTQMFQLQIACLTEDGSRQFVKKLVEAIMDEYGKNRHILNQSDNPSQAIFYNILRSKKLHGYLGLLQAKLDTQETSQIFNRYGTIGLTYEKLRNARLVMLEPSDDKHGRMTYYTKEGVDDRVPPIVIDSHETAIALGYYPYSNPAAAEEDKPKFRATGFGRLPMTASQKEEENAALLKETREQNALLKQEIGELKTKNALKKEKNAQRKEEIDLLKEQVELLAEQSDKRKEKNAQRKEEIDLLRRQVTLLEDKSKRKKEKISLLRRFSQFPTKHDEQAHTSSPAPTAANDGAVSPAETPAPSSTPASPRACP